MSNKLNLPTEFTELTSLIKQCTEDFSGSPITNKSNNKLNEIIAKRLGFKNYDTLASLIVKKEEIENSYSISYDYHAHGININNIIIENSLFDGDKVQYRISERENFLYDLMRFNVESRDSNRTTYEMNEDLKYLLSCEDEFILESVNGAGVIAFSKEPLLFNKYCQEILDYQNEIYLSDL
jgi:hypothetical protein